jgi:hypothetical protein
MRGPVTKELGTNSPSLRRSVWLNAGVPRPWCACTWISADFVA